MQDVVNAYWLEQFLEATYWNPDLDDHPLNALNMENENSRAFLVKEYLLPAWQELSPKQQSMVKDTFRYGLNTFSAQDWGKSTHYQLPDITRNPEDFFTDIWGRLFPGEPWHLANTEGYVRVDEREPSLHDNRFKYAR